MKKSRTTLQKRQSKTLNSLTGIPIEKLKMIFLCLAFSCSLGFGSVLEKTEIKAGVAKAVITNKLPRVMVNGNTSDADAFSAVEAYIPNYADTNRHKMVHGRSAASGDYSAVTDFFVSGGMGVWYSKVAINRIDVSAANGDDFLQYSNLYLYGVT